MPLSIFCRSSEENLEGLLVFSATPPQINSTVNSYRTAYFQKVIEATRHPAVVTPRGFNAPKRGVHVPGHRGQRRDEPWWALSRAQPAPSPGDGLGTAPSLQQGWGRHSQPAKPVLALQSCDSREQQGMGWIAGGSGGDFSPTRSIYLWGTADTLPAAGAGQRAGKAPQEKSPKEKNPTSKRDFQGGKSPICLVLGFFFPKNSIRKTYGHKEKKKT